MHTPWPMAQPLADADPRLSNPWTKTPNLETHEPAAHGRRPATQGSWVSRSKEAKGQESKRQKAERQEAKRQEARR
jgi:hypothetical protein